MKNKYPLLVSAFPKTALWGGQKLLRFLPDCPYEKFSELWVLSVRDEDNCVIRNGPEAGKTLREYLQTDAPFPLLIKFIDAADKLSVQVHPDDALAALDGDQGKTEMWHILEAEEGAELIYGLKEGKTAADFCQAVKNGDVDSVLHHQPVKAGETYFIPAGMIHGIGAGILVAEIQQNSDLTYRVYDYDRVGADGKKRPLHIEKSMAAAKEFTADAVDALQFEAGKKGIVNCCYFGVDQKEGAFSGTADTFEILLVTGGNGTVTANGQEVPLTAGDCCYLPAGLGSFTVSGDLTVLHVWENNN